MAWISRKHVYFIILNNYNGSKYSPLSRVLLNARDNLRTAAASYCSQAPAPAEIKESGDGCSPQKLSRAMQAYLKRTIEYEQFLKEQKEAYVKGKKFLAKIMDEDSENFDQEKIDEAIEYLFPSALYDKKARPCFKPPEVLFPKQKEAQFDNTGRPFHFLFYTSKPNFYQLLHECAQHCDNLNKKVLKLGPDAKAPKKTLALTGTAWLGKKELEEQLLEIIYDVEYETFIESMNRLLDHPYSYEAAEFISKYRRSEIEKKWEISFPPKIELENGQSLVLVERCRKKRCFATVKVLSPGTGKIRVNEKELIEIFPNIRTRGQVLYPLLFTNTLGRVDVEATVDESGPSAQAVAVRMGIAKGLLHFVSKEQMLEMKLAGLLKSDPRVRERDKPGQKGARAKYPWRKR